MKISEITKIIEKNPDVIFIDNHNDLTYRIEGFKTTANGVRVVVTRPIWGLYDEKTHTVIITESKTARIRQTNAIGHVRYFDTDNMKVAIKNQWLAQQTRNERANNAMSAIAELVPQLTASLKANGIEEMHTSRTSYDVTYSLKLSPENAAKLLALLNAGVAQ